MAKRCKDCGGRGQWQEREEDRQGNVTFTNKFCNTCAGTGIVREVEDDDAFDVAGSLMGDEED